MEEMIFPMGSVGCGQASFLDGFQLEKQPEMARKSRAWTKWTLAEDASTFIFLRRSSGSIQDSSGEVSVYEHTNSSRDLSEESVLDSEASLLRAQTFCDAVSSMGSREERA